MAKNEEGWNTLSQKTEAKVTRSYTQNNEHRVEEEVLIGTPEEVRRMAAPKYAGEVTEIEDVHTITRLERELSMNTTHGVMKKRETRTVQTYDFGDGKTVPSGKGSSRTVGTSDDVEEPEEIDEPGNGKLDRVGVLKNFVDNVAEDVRGLNWKTLGIAVIAVAALVIAVMTAMR